jgi:serine/threonine-protein kinase
MNCPDGNTIIKFLQGRLAPQEAASLEEHVDQCSTCRRSFAELAHSSLVETARATTQDPAGEPEEQVLPTVGDYVGRFEIIEQLGKGGMGIVFLARDPDLDREVCLKFLRRNTSSEEESRVLREARSMARLSHPNVVTVYEVGKFNDRLFVVMEYVEGMNLREWLIQNKPNWRMVLDVFTSAAKGLAAAHQAGVVHCDFKPDNVLLAQDKDQVRRVLVGDFGLAYFQTPDHPKKLEKIQIDNQGLLDTITIAGKLPGTPAYMAPEQIQGQQVDIKSDQFSFCVALFEALYDARPFGGKNLAAIEENILAGRIDYPSRKPALPGWLKEIFIVGLNPDPDQRHASMAELANLLSKKLNKNKRLISAAIAFALMLVVLMVVVWLGHPQPCPGAEDKLVGIWDKSRKTTLKKSFLATKLPFAQQTFVTTAKALDDYRQTWLKQHQAACLAGQVRQETSLELLDRRMECLDQRLQEFKIVTDYLSRPDNEIVSKAIDITGNMTSADICFEADALASLAPIPKDVDTKKAVQKTRAKMKKLEAMLDSGKIKPLLNLAQEIDKEADQIEFVPLKAESLYWLGKVQRTMGKPRPAKKTFDQAIRLGMAADHQRLVALSWIELVKLIGVDLAQPKEAIQLADTTLVMLDRLAADEELKADLLFSQAKVSSFAGQPEKVKDKFQAALEIFERRFGTNHPKTLGVRAQHIINVLISLGEFARAQKEIEKVQIVLKESYGLEHPKNILLLWYQAVVQNALGNYQKEKELAKKALSLSEKIYGPKHPQTALCHQGVGQSGGYMEDLSNKLQHIKKALAINQEVFGPQHPYVTDNYRTLASIYNEAGQYQKAKVAIQKSIEIAESVLGDDHYSVYQSYSVLAYIQKDQGKLDEALLSHYKVIEWNKRKRRDIFWWYEDNLAVAQILMEKGELNKASDEIHQTTQAFEKKFGTSHPDYSDCLLVLLELLVATKDYTQAQQVLSEYLQIITTDSDPISAQSSMGHLASGKYYQATKEHDLALEHFQQLLKTDEQLYGKQHHYTSEGLIGIGRALLDLDRQEEALPYIQRAHNIQKSIQGDPIDLAEIEFALARALWDTNKDRSKALELAQNAYKIYTDNPRYSQRDQLSSVKKWLGRR